VKKSWDTVRQNLPLPLAFCCRSAGDWSRESGIWMVPVGVEIPRTRAGIGAGEIRSQVSKFTVTRGEMSSADGNDENRKRLV